jgi:sulfite reductase beta subunit-like hemoprotein
LDLTPEQVGDRVVTELIEMGLLDPAACADPKQIRHHFRYCPWANVIFDHDTRPALETLWSWLETHGLAREPGDLDPLTDWNALPAQQPPPARLAMAGRFGQWKYYWTDDCVLRGRQFHGD